MLNAIGGTIYMYSRSLLAILLAFRGIVQMGWVLATNGSFLVTI